MPQITKCIICGDEFEYVGEDPKSCPKCRGKYTICVYCGQPIRRLPEEVDQHVKQACPAHPLRDAEKEIAELKTALREIESRMQAIETLLSDTIARLS